MLESRGVQELQRMGVCSVWGLLCVPVAICGSHGVEELLCVVIVESGFT